MKKEKTQKVKALIPQEIIEQKIYLIRGMKVMIDSDLALMYGVDTKVFNQAVKRNSERLPEDFMFQLKEDEMESLRSQIVTSKRGGRRYNAYVFTEQGVAMLSSVLNSKRAVDVNIQIIRTFVKLREMIISNKVLRLKMEDMEKKYDKRFKVVFDILKNLIKKTNTPASREMVVEKKESIGFKDRKK